MTQEKEYILWNPMRKYQGKTKEQILQETDLYMEELLKGYECWEELLKKYADRIDRKLAAHAKASELVQTVLEPDFQTCCRVEYLFSCFSVAAQIGKIEEENGLISNTNQCGSMEEVCVHMQEMVFGLRRIEFGWEEEEVLPFLEKALEWQLSYVFLGEIICQRTITDKIRTTERLAGFWEKYGRHKEVILLLFYVANRLENMEEAVLTFVNVLLESGDLYWGNELLQKIKDPSPEVRELQKMLLERL